MTPNDDLQLSEERHPREGGDLLAYQNRINKVLDKILPAATQEPQRLHQAMRYGVLNGGKRIRPLFVYATGETLGADIETLDIPAAAIELIHCYSLIHDDLPEMDNDDMRRGKPTCHKAFDAATAILAGDALYNHAIQILADSDLPANMCKQMLSVITNASGSLGMAGGQAIDLAAVDTELSLEQLEHMHNLKTGFLIRASVKLGAIAAKANTQQLENLDNYAKCLGLVFQIQDDILDKDEIEDNKANYVTLLGVGGAQQKLLDLQHQTTVYLDRLDVDNSLLIMLTEFIMQRQY